MPKPASCSYVVNAVLRCAMSIYQIAPRNPQRLLQYSLGQPGQAVADLHDRQLPVEIGNGDAEHRRPLELANYLHAGFAVILYRKPLA